MDNTLSSTTRLQSGFTLIELMIVVVVITIIAALAYPSYQQQAMKASRTDATSALLAIAAAQEKEFLKNNAFSDDLIVLGITETDADKYTLSVELTENGGFLAKADAGTATSKSQKSDLDCLEFSIDHTGAKRSTGSNASGVLSATDHCW